MAGILATSRRGTEQDNRIALLPQREPQANEEAGIAGETAVVDLVDEPRFLPVPRPGPEAARPGRPLGRWLGRPEGRDGEIFGKSLASCSSGVGPRKVRGRNRRHRWVAMGRDKDKTGADGWTHLEEPPAGMPEAEYVRLAPLLAELAEWEAHIARTQAVNPDNPDVKGMAFCMDRIQGRIWQARELIEEKTPPALARQLGVSAQTIRNWCNDGKVEHWRRGKFYFVDVRSAREYAKAL